MHKVSRKITGSLLLLVLFISAAPRLFLHNITAGHTDHLYHLKKINDTGKQFEAYRYNCGFDNSEATTPYLPVDVLPQLIRHIYYNAYPAVVSVGVNNCSSTQLPARGPPQL